jgi:pyruvate dehydrogenase E1 component alpha subunit/2-oxoisovalerate dehydrogenase E1 component alpha subunit
MADLTREQRVDIYRFMRLNRGAEDRLVNLYRQGKVVGGLYRSLGEEATAVGSAYALGKGEIVGPMIRNLGSVFVMGYSPRDVFTSTWRAPRRLGSKDSTLHFGTRTRARLPHLDARRLVAVMADVSSRRGCRRRRSSR